MSWPLIAILSGEDDMGVVNDRITGIELAMLIQSLEATPAKARSMDQNWKLSALLELRERRGELTVSESR